MKKAISVIYYTMLLSFAICIPLSVQAKTKVSTPTKVRTRSNESKRLKVKWNKVKNADGYQIYEYKKSKRGINMAQNSDSVEFVTSKSLREIEKAL